MHALTICDAEVVSTCTQQSVSSRVSSVGRWMKCLGRFKMQALTHCNAEVVSARTQQSVSSRVSSRGRWNVTHGFDSRQSSPPATHTHTHDNGQHTSGAMDNSSRRVQNARTHAPLRTRKAEHTVNSGAMEEISRQGQKVSSPKMPDSSTRWCWSVLLCPRRRVPRPASQKPST